MGGFDIQNMMQMAGSSMRHAEEDAGDGGGGLCGRGSVVVKMDGAKRIWA